MKKHFKYQNLAIGILFMLLGLLAIITLWQNNLILTLVLLVIFLVMHYFWATHRDTVAFVVGAIGGPLAEVVAIHFKVWQYSNPAIIGEHIPLWLPVAWGIAAMLIHRATLVPKR